MKKSKILQMMTKSKKSENEKVKTRKKKNIKKLLCILIISLDN